MSAEGEFKRIAGEMITFLESSDDVVVRRLAVGLRSNADYGELEFLQAAERVLELLGGVETRTFYAVLAREEFDRRMDYLETICRVVLGR